MTRRNTGDYVILLPHLSEKSERRSLLINYKIVNQTREASERQLACMILPNKNEKSSISSLIVDEKELTPILPTLQQLYWPIVTISYFKQR